MDLNLVVLCGRVAVPPDHQVLEGESLLRLLLTTRSDTPHRRVDVIPIVLWDPPQDLLDGSLTTGARVWVYGVIQRRLWEDPTGGSRSKIEVVARRVETDQRAPIAG